VEERLPLLKRADVFVFKKIDEFRATPGYSKMLEAYTSLEETEQKIAKAAMLGATALIPILILFALWVTNFTIKSDLETRSQLVTRMQEIIAHNNAAGNLINTMAAPVALADQGAMSSQVNSIAMGSGIDGSKLRVTNFTTDSISAALARSEADFKFDGLSTPQLMGLFTAMLGRERFRISNVSIIRNEKSNQLDGTFHAVHFGQIPPPVEN